MDLLELIDSNPSLFKKQFIKHYRKGTYLLKQGEALEDIYFILEGSGIVNQLSIDGEEHLVHYFRKGDCAGKAVFFHTAKEEQWFFSQINIIAKTDCKVYQIPLEYCYNYANKNSDIYKYIINMLNQELFRCHQDLVLLRENKTSSILCNFLLENVELKNEKYIIDKWFNYEDLSHILGIHSVTSSRIMRKLIEEKVIEKGRKMFIILDMDQLKQFASGRSIIQYY